MMKSFFSVLALFVLVSPMVLAAVDFDQPVTPGDESTFDAMLAPLMKVYGFLRYAATALAGVFLVYEGIMFITSGSDQMQRERAKSSATYVLIGLIVIWIAPLAVQFLVA